MRASRPRSVALVVAMSATLLAACSSTTAQAPVPEQEPLQMAAPGGNGQGNGQDTAPGQDPDRVNGNGNGNGAGNGNAADPDAGMGTVDPTGPTDPQPPTAGTIPLIGSTNKDFRNFTSPPGQDKKPAREMMSPPERPSGGPDAAIQTTPATVAPPAPGTPFEGMSLNANGNGWPPDTTGDVGPNHFIQAVNTSLAMYTKNGSIASGPFTFNSFFASANTKTPCDTANQGDPVVLYDGYSGRWIITDFAWSSNRGPWYECIAVSKTSDPVSGGWNFYGFQASTTAMNDYPKFGVWGSGIWMTANMFKGGRTYANAQVWALNRDDMTNGAAAIRFVTWNMGSSNFSLLPANYDGLKTSSDAPAATADQYIVSSYGSTTSLSLWKMNVNWGVNPPTGTASPTKISVPVSSYTKASGRVSQLGSTETLDALGDRLMYPLQYRKGSLWVSQSVAPSSGHFGVRWWQIDPAANAVQQQSTWAPDTTLERWMPSLAVNGKGELGVVYSASSATAYPSIRMSGRTAGAAKEILDVKETVLQAGGGSQNGGYNRWGDYAVVAVDPNDDCTFWYSTEYYPATGNDWHTKFGSFRISTCP